jgi:hypothetical protein
MNTQEIKYDSVKSGDAPRASSVVVRDLTIVATELRERAPEINAKVERLEKSQSITQEILDLEFTI